MRHTLELQGLDPTPAFAVAGLDPNEADLDRRVSRGQERTFQRAFLALTGRKPTMWFRMGMDYSIAAFGPYALVMMTAPNLRVMLTGGDASLFGYHGIRVKPILFSNRLIGVEFDASTVPPDLRDLALIVSCGCACRIYPEMVGDAFAFSTISLPFQREEFDPGQLPDLPLRWNADRMVLQWEDRMSELPLRNANPVLHRVHVEGAASMMQTEQADDHLRETVLSILSRNLRSPATLEDVARELGMTSRTLQRRLGEAGVTFRGLAEDCRRKQAIHLLAFTEVPLMNVAWTLGYNDLASFSHAFQRWSAIPPSRFRRQIRTQKPFEDPPHRQGPKPAATPITRRAGAV